jgi:hypothetical protein
LPSYAGAAVMTSGRQFCCLAALRMRLMASIGRPSMLSHFTPFDRILMMSAVKSVCLETSVVREYATAPPIFFSPPSSSVVVNSVCTLTMKPSFFTAPGCSLSRYL